MKTELPEPFKRLLVLLDGGELGPIPAVCYGRQDDGDSDGMVFVSTTGNVAYVKELVLDWKYLRDVCPEYELPESEKFIEEADNE